VKRLERWSGGAQDDHGRLFLGTNNCGVTPVVVRRILLAIRRLMFFIDDNEAKILDRREDCRAGPNDDSRFTISDSCPFVKAFTSRQGGMKYCYLIAEVHFQTF